MNEIKQVGIKTHDERVNGLWLDHGDEYQLFLEEIAELRAALEALQADTADLKDELERERIRLAACGVAALENTKACVNKRINKDNPYYSASYSDVCRAVDAEIRLREEVAAQAKRIESLEKSLAACLEEATEWIYESRGCSPQSIMGYNGWADIAKQILSEKKVIE